MAKILVVDDHLSMLAVLSNVLRSQQYEVLLAHSAPEALEMIKQAPPDLVLADIEMPTGEPTGLRLLRQVKELNRAIPFVVISGNGTKERVMEALRSGAQDFIERPFLIDELIKRVANALLIGKALPALRENAELKNLLREKFRFDDMIGTSAAMETVYRMIERVADTDSTILILGESGTGKELVAKALHYNSRRAALPFVAVNCSALPEHLLESELFGHRRGAFTGAALDKVGLFQHADGGTIFLDEIGSMAPSMQTKLLRFLQDKELRRVGDNISTKVDVRVLAATNAPLEEQLKAKTFREDLFYRISVIPIELPPLRVRVEDIPLLVAHFVATLSEHRGTPAPRVSETVMDLFRAYRWPGNVRELQNALEHACALCDGGCIEVRDLPERMRPAEATPVGLAATGRPELDHSPPAPALDPHRTAEEPQFMPLKDYLDRQALAYIRQVLSTVGDNKSQAAILLGVSVVTLYRRLGGATDTGQGPDDRDRQPPVTFIHESMGREPLAVIATPERAI